MVKTDRRRTYTSWRCRRSWCGSLTRHHHRASQQGLNCVGSHQSAQLCCPSRLELLSNAACLINLHYPFEGLRIVHALYACLLSSWVDLRTDACLCVCVEVCWHYWSCHVLSIVYYLELLNHLNFWIIVFLILHFCEWASLPTHQTVRTNFTYWFCWCITFGYPDPRK